jgi:hypothetical protein
LRQSPWLPLHPSPPLPSRQLRPSVRW